MEKINSKVLLFGEYSVLHNSMALTIPYSRFSGELGYPKTNEESAIAVLSNKGIREFCKHILENHTDDTFKLNVNKLSQELDKGLFFRSNIPQGFGLGSSGALVAAIFLRYLEKAGDFKDELKDFTLQHVQNLKKCLGNLEGHFHGASSGIDPLSIIINEPLLVKSNKEIVKVDIPIQNKTGKNVLFLLNTHINRDSNKLIKQFTNACTKKEFKRKLDVELIEYTNSGINDFLKGDIKNFYLNLEKIVRFQHQEMNYLIPNRYLPIIDKGIEHGDFFLKICGSGGGGYMLGFTQNWKATQQRLKNEDLEILYQF